MPAKGKGKAKPTRAEILGYYEMLRCSASKGNVDAAGKLIELDLISQDKAGREPAK